MGDRQLLGSKVSVMGVSIGGSCVWVGGFASLRCRRNSQIASLCRRDWTNLGIQSRVAGGATAAWRVRRAVALEQEKHRRGWCARHTDAHSSMQCPDIAQEVKSTVTAPCNRSGGVSIGGRRAALASRLPSWPQAAIWSSPRLSRTVATWPPCTVVGGGGTEEGAGGQRVSRRQ